MAKACPADKSGLHRAGTEGGAQGGFKLAAVFLGHRGEVKHHRFGIYAAAQRPLLESAERNAELLYQSVIAYYRFLEENPEFARLISWMHLEEAEEQEFAAGDDPAAAELIDLLRAGLHQRPGFTLRGGTNEILRGVIARALGMR